MIPFHGRRAAERPVRWAAGIIAKLAAPSDRCIRPMRRIALGSLLFLFGMVVGAFATDALHMWSRPLLAASLRTAIQIQEEFLASRTAREGNLVESLIHRTNAAS